MHKLQDPTHDEPAIDRFVRSLTILEIGRLLLNRLIETDPARAVQLLQGTDGTANQRATPSV